VSPIVVLISFDGWRWDYITRAKVPHIQALESRGVRAEGLIPVFPAKTFPNHYTIVTGLYPEHHGIVSNAMVDPAIGERFTLSSETAKDARWWGGEPIWVTAIRQGRRSASMFWPGSEVLIGGLRPTYWKPFDTTLPNGARVKQVLDWLALPADQQPSFVTLYFSEVDQSGHDAGPESPEVLVAASHLDEALGELVSGVEKLKLTDRTTFVVVSDHGMSQLSDSRVVFLDDYVDVSDVDVIEWTPMLALAPRAGSVDNVYQALKDRHPALTVYKREETPAALRYRDNPRIAPIIGLLDEGWTLTTHGRLAGRRAAGRRLAGDHGYDSKHRSMHGLFVAAGPRVVRGLHAPAFEAVHVYELLAEILGLSPVKNDGDPNVTRTFLRD
jgi:predicted AlkP superfamily pyrophosphatase or phosphodiesterase